MNQQDRFLRVLKALQDWHADAVKARDYDAAAAGGGKPGHRVLRRQHYPSSANCWAAWRRAGTDIEREAVIHSLENEYAALGKRPTRIEQYRDAWGKTRYRVVAPEAQA